MVHMIHGLLIDIPFQLNKFVVNLNPERIEWEERGYELKCSRSFCK